MPTPTSRTTYVGIELLTAIGNSHRSFCYVGLDSDLKLTAIGSGSLADALAYAGGQADALVAINAPRHPNQGLMRQEEFRQQLTPPPKPTSWQDYRVVEYLLRQRHIPVLHTSARKEDCLPWVQAGFELFTQLEKLGFTPYPAEESHCLTLEVHPHTAFCALLGQAPFGRETLEGRLQRQLVLNQKGVRVADPMLFFEEVTVYKLLKGVLPLKDIYSPGELDALVAAYTAWMAANHPSDVSLLGAAEEGQIVVPVAEMKEQY